MASSDRPHGVTKDDQTRTNGGSGTVIALGFARPGQKTGWWKVRIAKAVRPQFCYEIVIDTHVDGHCRRLRTRVRLPPGPPFFFFLIGIEV